MLDPDFRRCCVLSLKPADLSSALSTPALATLRERLVMWWNGESLPVEQPEPVEAVAAALDAMAAEPPPSSGPAVTWPAPRIAVIQRLFGEGFTSPGGADGARAIIKALGLDSTMSVLDLSGALGGMGRLIARETGAWVTSVEADNVLAAAGMEMSVMAGLAKKAPVIHGDLGNPGVRKKSQNAILAKERLYTVADKAALFSGLRDLLKPGGQISFTDYMLADAGAGGEALDNWCAVEPTRPHLLDPEAHRSILLDLHFEVRVIADITGEFCARLVKDFSHFADSLKHSPLTPEEKAWVVREARYWLHRVAAIDSGALKVYRVFAWLK
jgi:SAM-dependent methyltransferase